MLLYGSISTGSPVSDSFGHQFSIKAFWDVLADPNVIRAFHNTLVVCFGGTVLAVFFGLFFSWVTARTNTPLRRTIEAVCIMPLLIPPLVAGIAWSILGRSEEHTSELQSLMRISYAVFCLKKKKHYSQYTL